MVTFTTLISGQEVVLPKDVVQRQHALPDTLVYGVLFRQAAALKEQADEWDREGKDGSPFRKHLAHKFQLSPEQILSLDTAALQYKEEVADVEMEIQQSVSRFQQSAQLVKGQAVPPLPSEARYLISKHDAVVLRARDRFHTLLGDEDFARIDGLVKARMTKDFTRVQPGLANHIAGGQSNATEGMR
jgi:hypothetical protein